jgi:hypothetical protein
MSLARRSPALAFWLDYLSARGGLWEQSGDTVLAVLPDQLAATHDLPESALITDDPDIAREDGVLFLGAGHPEIDKAAEAAVDDGDVAVVTVAHPAKPLSTEDVLARVRDQVPIEHGRIDATATPIRTHRPVLRLGVLVSHTVSAEETFTEVAECLVDVASRVAWPEDSAALVRQAASTAGRPGREPRTPGLVPALAAARDLLDEAAAVRGQALAAGADAERAEEIARASDYYAAALAAIDKRRTGADPHRTALLDSRAQVTLAERDRRLTEITEKYRHSHALRPYRLHLIDIPAWRLATDVRRGDRRWPVTFDYLPLLGTVAPTRCPNCQALASLVAAKSQLGCTICLPRSTPTPPTSGTPRSSVTRKPPATQQGAARTASPRPAPASTTDHGRRPPPAERPHRAPAAGPARRPVVESTGPALPGKAEERKVINFWNHVGAGDHRTLARLVAVDSPLAALVRLYGAAGPLNGIGVPAGVTPRGFTSDNYDRPVAGNRGGTAGTLETNRDEYPYLLLWSSDRVLDEILPYSAPWQLGRASWFLQPPKVAPAPRIDLDPVAELLFTRTTAHHGLPFTARALAAWWRLTGSDDLLTRFEPTSVAAAVDRAIRYWSGAQQATYPNAARAFQADEAAVRKVTPILQKQLQLSPTRNW